MAAEELQQLQGHHAKVKSKLATVQQQLQITSSNLEEEEGLRHRSEAQVVLLQDRLEHADVEHQHLTRQVGIQYNGLRFGMAQRFGIGIKS